jgi:hypothetical protein
MVLAHVLRGGLLYGGVVTGYLLLVMVSTSPRVWGYADYPEAITSKVPPQTAEEKRLAWIVGVPWLIFTLGFPIYSTLQLKSKLAGELPFSMAFLNLLVLFLAATFGDLILLDWLILSRITPGFVIIPGTSKEDYKEFSHQLKAHARSAIPLVVLCIVLAAVISAV